MIVVRLLQGDAPCLRRSAALQQSVRCLCGRVMLCALPEYLLNGVDELERLFGGSCVDGFSTFTFKGKRV